MKRRFKNLSKGKFAVGLIAMCLVVFAGYFGYHKFIVHADSKPTKQVVNTLAEYNAMSENGKVDLNAEAGSRENPFLILEIVPYYGQAEFGYVIPGCEPIDFTKVNPSLYSGASDGIRTTSTTVFSDEYKRDANNDGVVDESCWEDDTWNHETSKTVTAHGCYEKISDKYFNEDVLRGGGYFVIDKYVKDDTGKFYVTVPVEDAKGDPVKDENGKEKTEEQVAYRPVFRRATAEDENKQLFTWVSWFNDRASGFCISKEDFNKSYALKENKCASEKDVNKAADPDKVIEYTPGEREYTTRTDTDYYYINEGGWMDKVVDGKKESVFAGHVVSRNDFIRTSLNLEDDKSEGAIQDLCIAIKTIEPQELKNHPEWIDYADLMYIHQSYSVGSYGNWWKEEKYTKYHRVKDELGESFYKNDANAQEKCSDYRFTADNDWGWNVAKKLFLKSNQIEPYDGEGEYNFAPLLFSVTALDNLNGLSESVYGAKWKTVTHQHLDYTTMEADGIQYNTGATSCGLYKFMLMNFLMDQENFNSYFLESGVITEDKSKDVSYCSPQTGDDAKEYWSVDAFLPVTEKVNDTNISDDQVERYKISHYGGAYLNYPRPALHGATFIYNSDTLLSQGFNNASIGNDANTKEAFDWFEEEYGENHNSLTPAQMVHYLLQYGRGSNNPEKVGTRDKDTMHVLEIEPCSEFTMTEQYLIGKYLPASSFKGKIEVDHMTTAEFNGLKRDLNGYYDLIYIGDNSGKFNRDSGKKTVHNDSALDGYIYLHIGDNAGGVRSSGDDISKIKKEKLDDYVKGGNALVLADDLASFPVGNDGKQVTGGAYIDTYSKIVDPTSNMHAFLNKIKSDKGAKFAAQNVCALSKLSQPFLKNYCLYYSGQGYAFPTRFETSLKSKKYTEMKNRYKDIVGLYAKITATSPRYYSDVVFADEDDVNYAIVDDQSTGTSHKKEVSVKESISEPKLSFDFMIGDQREKKGQYGVRLYIDLNGDGIIKDNELVEDTFANGSGRTYSYAGEDAKDSNGNVYKAKDGTAIQVPRTQNYSYDFSKNNQLYLNKNKKNGAISWKFVLYNTAQKQNYQAVTGVSWYKNDNWQQQTTTIKALQVISDNAKAEANLEEQLKDSGSLFSQYGGEQALKDFNCEISVTTLTLSDFQSQVAAKTLGGDGGDDYNCYIVSGGSDLFSKEDYKDAADYINLRAAKEGIPVIFTGSDAMNVAAGTNNSRAKDILNMSRFTKTKADDDLYGDINDTAKSPRGTKYTGKLEYTYAKVMQEGKGDNKVYSNDIWTNVSYGSAAKKTTKVSRNNRGRVTTYPYTIDETSMSIAKTGAQDYQLNMDNKGLAVWYSLHDEDETTQYGISPRDAANNYYLYSIDNVIYDLIDLENVTDPMEMKLFINTLSGNVVSPAVEVVSANTVDTNYKNFTISKTNLEDYYGKNKIPKTEDGLEMTLYDGSLEPGGSNYQDYESGAKKINGSGNGGGKIDDPGQTPIPATPTPKPKKEPVILVDQPGGAHQGNCLVSADTSKGWDNSAILVIDYQCEGNWWTDQSDNFAGIYDSSGQNKKMNIQAKTQTLKIKLGDLKEALGVDSSAELPDFKIQGCWQFILCSVGIYEDAEQYNEYKNGGSSSDSDNTIIDDNKEEYGDHEEIRTPDGKKNEKYIKDSDTHRISFVPYTNLSDSQNVTSFKISLVTASGPQKGGSSTGTLGTSEEKTVKVVKEIYQKYTDAAGQYLWKYTASKDGTFTLKEKNYLKDSTQYYFMSDDSYINDTLATDSENTKWVRFDISNRRKSAVTYLHLFYEGNPDTTYVFPLD